jgi:hypothetical protein
MEAIRVEFEFERETKHTFRYQEVTAGKPEVVGTLYVQQSAFGGRAPQKIQVTIVDATAEGQGTP